MHNAYAIITTIAFITFANAFPAIIFAQSLRLHKYDLLLSPWVSLRVATITGTALDFQAPSLINDS